MKLERLDDYLTGSAADDDAFEEAMFEAAARDEAPDLVFLDRALRNGRGLHERGTFSPGVRRQELAGRPATMVALPRDGIVDVPRDAELVAYRLEVDTRGVERIDLDVFVRGRKVKTIADLPFEPGAGEVLLLCEGELARFVIGPEVELHVVGVGAERKVLREYRARGRVV